MITGTGIRARSGSGTRRRHGFTAATRRDPVAVEPPVVVPGCEHALRESSSLVEGNLVHEFFEVGLRALRDPLLDPVRARVVRGDSQERLTEARVELRQIARPEGDVHPGLPERGDLV